MTNPPIGHSSFVLPSTFVLRHSSFHRGCTTHRTGATLVEVLVAIFVMGLGMIALLTLFPLGALRMAQAIQDDRCASAVHCADAIATLKDTRNDPTVRTPQWLGTGDIFRKRLILAPPAVTYANAGPNQFSYADYDTGPSFVSTTQGQPPIPIYYDGPSFPVYVDPIGYQSLNIPAVNARNTSQNWVGYGGGGNYLAGNVDGVLARTTVSFAAGNVGTYKWFTLVDDHQFQSQVGLEGTANIPNTSVIRRDIRYSWAYLLQRPKSSDPSVVNCTVVVYNRRPLGLSFTAPPVVTSGTGLAASMGETAYNAIFATSTSFNVTTSAGKLPSVPGNSITIDTRAGSPATFAPSLRVGDWLLDVTLVKADVYEVVNPATGILTLLPSPPLRSAHANFYRVTNITRVSDNVLVCEVQQPIRDFRAPAVGVVPGGRAPQGVRHAVINSYYDFLTNNFTVPNAATTAFNGGVMVLEGVADVYERGLDRKFD